MEFDINVYNGSDNNSRDEMIQFISEHNDKFAEYTLIESARMWNLIPNVEEKSDEQILEGYYERLFGIVNVIPDDRGDGVDSCIFIRYLDPNKLSE